MATNSCLDDMIGTSQGTDGAIQRGWALEPDWVRHQTLIAQLYEEKTLPEVMRIMDSQHGFKATLVGKAFNNFVPSHSS